MLRLSFKQQVFTGFAVSVLLVLLVGVLAYKSIHKLEGDSDMVEHTQKVIKTSTHILQLITNAETGMRGFVATNDTVFLDPYKAALPQIKAEVTQLRSLVSDNPEEQRRVDSMSFQIDKELVIQKYNIDTRPVKGLEYMVQANMLLNGKRNMDAIRSFNARIVTTENNLLAARKAKSAATAANTLIIIVGGSAVFLIIVIILFFYIDSTFQRQQKVENEIKVTNIELAKVLNENTAKNWQLLGTSLLNEKMLGQQTEKELAENILTEICSYTKAATGTFYLYSENNESLDLYASYAFNNPDALKQTIKAGEGWMGQVAKDKKSALVKGRLNDKLELGSSLLQQDLTESFIVPFFFDHRLIGIVEVAYAGEIRQECRDYILSNVDVIGITVNTAQARTIMHDLLAQVQQQTEELESQQEEMRVTNEELLSKTEMLQASEEELIVQQEELRSTNAELEEKASLLEEKNQAIEEARQAINLKVQELETTGKYKSEFLANMSHELRTPLNSILVLARILIDNKPANLSADQVKYAGVIFNAGNDLLTLINDILDLSKIESGKVDLQHETVPVKDILQGMENLFAQFAHNKKIKYTVGKAKDAPGNIITDKIKVEQILKNLLSNAFKFTPEKGSVEINVTTGNKAGTIDFRIKDSGIGIPKDKQKVIFEAFQQADGSTSRRYGGTGLGLSISRELAALLGGAITVISEVDRGSEFILTIPLKPAPAKTVANDMPTTEDFIPASFLPPVTKPTDDNGKDPLVIIVEDDKNFAGILQDYARDHGYNSILASEGTGAVELIKENLPDAVILDIMLPGKDGWQILKELKQDEATMHIPVHLMSAGDVAAKRVNHEGAISFLKKPVNKDVLDKLFSDMMVQTGAKFKQILLIEDNKAQNNALYELMQNRGITVDQAFDGASALTMLDKNQYQCIILDLNLPDISGLDLLDKIKASDRFQSLPVIINTAMELDKTSVSRLMQYANAMVVKTNKSSDRLIDEVNLFLNKISKGVDQHTGKPSMSANIPVQEGSDYLKGRKILIVDDDLRNIFALSSALQDREMIIEVANDGKEAIEKLESTTDIELVLMDIMMPVMDGYEAMRHIRKQSKWDKLPVIALTAKAMKDDKEKCMEAGATDYITKPVDIDRLLSLMQLWLGN